MKKSLSWLPGVVSLAVIAGGAFAVPAIGDALAPPTKSASQVLALIAQSTDAHYSGTIEQTSDLGLPQLPTSGPGSDSSDSAILDLLTASHKVRVFADGPSKQRVQVLDSLAERDVIHNGNDVWTYDSKQNAVTHLSLPSKQDAARADSGATTPAELATKFIAAITPSTKITVEASASVAGRSAYQLTLAPKGSGTLISNVTLSIDSATGLPLKVVVEASGQSDTAFSVGFTSIDFSTPAAKTFDFTPPKGAKVTTKSLSDAGSLSRTATPTPGTKPTISGSGWSSIVELPAGALGATASKADASQAQLLDQLTTAVDGGRALETSLLSVLLTSDGRVLVGAVPVSSLEAAAAAQ